MPTLEQVYAAARTVWPEPCVISISGNTAHHVSADYSQQTDPTPGYWLSVTDGADTIVFRTNKPHLLDELMDIIEEQRKQKDKKP